MNKTITITGAKEFLRKDDFYQRVDVIVAIGDESMTASDGYHTFEELYDHRIRLFIALCRNLSTVAQYIDSIWMSEFHHDLSSLPGWFILGINQEPGKQITYHLPKSYWDECLNFAKKLETAPEFDGHTSADVLNRLKLV